MPTTTDDDPIVTVVIANGEALVGVECEEGDYFDPGMYELAGVKWASWSTAPDYIPVATRLNSSLTSPARLVHRNGITVDEPVHFRLPTRAEFSQIAGYLNDGDLYTYKVLVATVAATRKDHDLKTCARTSGFTEKDLTAEVQGWRAAVELGVNPR